LSRRAGTGNDELRPDFSKEHLEGPEGGRSRSTITSTTMSDRSPAREAFEYGSTRPTTIMSNASAAGDRPSYALSGPHPLRGSLRVWPATSLDLVWACCNLATNSECRADNVPPKAKWGQQMTDRISPAFHAELIVVFFNDYKDLRKVAERVGVLLSDASAEHIEAVGKYLPIDLMRALPRRMLRAA
jgi:hypothetical protein